MKDIYCQIENKTDVIPKEGQENAAMDKLVNEVKYWRVECRNHELSFSMVEAHNKEMIVDIQQLQREIKRLTCAMDMDASPEVEISENTQSVSVMSTSSCPNLVNTRNSDMKTGIDIQNKEKTRRPDRSSSKRLNFIKPKLTKLARDFVDLFDDKMTVIVEEDQDDCVIGGEFHRKHSIGGPKPVKMNAFSDDGYLDESFKCDDAAPQSTRQGSNRSNDTQLNRVSLHESCVEPIPKNSDEELRGLTDATFRRQSPSMDTLRLPNINDSPGNTIIRSHSTKTGNDVNGIAAVTPKKRCVPVLLECHSPDVFVKAANNK